MYLKYAILFMLCWVANTTQPPVVYKKREFTETELKGTSFAISGTTRGCVHFVYVRLSRGLEEAPITNCMIAPA